MTLSAPVSISTVGDAQLVRHLRAGGSSWAVWTFDDDGRGARFAVRERTGVISVVGGLQTDGTDFSERVIPLSPVRVESFHCLELAANEVAFLFSDGQRLFTFLWDLVGNTVLSPVTELATGAAPSQFQISAVLRRVYTRDQRAVYLRVGAGPENKIIDVSGGESLDLDVVRKGITALARYAGQHAINRDLALPFLADANTVLAYNADDDLVTVTEALPAGTVGYFTFDSADFSGTTMLNQAPAAAFNATLVGTAPASVAGKVGQARSFTGGTGSGHYSLGSPAALSIVGDMSLAFWLQANNLSQRVNPYDKAYGGEGTITLETDGSLNFFYGTNGGNGSPYTWINSGERIGAGAWWHIGVVRDATNRFMRWFLNGECVAHVTAAFNPAVSAAAVASIGKGYTGYKVDGLMDEMLIAGAAFSPQQFAGLYAKGLAAAKANTSGLGSARRLLDSGAGARHGILSAYALSTVRGTARGGGAGALVVAAPSFVAPSALTIEARLWPRYAVAGDRVVFGNRIYPDSSGGRIQGTVDLVYKPDGMLAFRFETASATVELQQTGGSRIRTNALNHIAVSHTFGAGGSSFLMVNGDEVPARWIGGGGNETPTMLAAAPSLGVNPGDELLGLRVSNVAKSQAGVRDYLRGRS